MNRTKPLRIAILIVFVLVALAGYAQLGPPPPPPPPPPPDDGIPLGGEIFLLLGAGISYAIKKFRNKN